MGGTEILITLGMILLVFATKRLPGLETALERFLGIGVKELLKGAVGEDRRDESEQQRPRNRSSGKEPSPNRDRAAEHSIGGEGSV